MHPFVPRWFSPLLIVVVGMIALQINYVQGQDPTFLPTPELNEAKEAFNRLEQVGNEFRNETYQKLLAEGKEILALAQQYYEGKMPLSNEVKEATAKSARLSQEAQDLDQRIRAFNNNPKGTQEEADTLNNESRNLNERMNAHNEYVEKDLNVRVKANNKKVIELYVEFVRKANKFLVAVVDASAVKSSVSKGEKPPFEPLWRVHDYSRDIAKGLASDENRCAIRLSMTLGLIPIKGEASLNDIGNETSLKEILKHIKGTHVKEEVKDADLGKRYYIKSSELARRLKEEWKSSKPLYAQGKDAVEKILLNKKGVVFFDGGFGFDGKSNHIDLWDGKQWASYDPQQGGTDFEQASKRAISVWFWEISK